MKQLLFLFLGLFIAPLALLAQADDANPEDSLEPTIDTIADDFYNIDFSKQKFISDLSQLPAQQYYKQDWCEEHVRLKALNPSFKLDTVKLVLKKEEFVFPVHNGKVISEYGMRHGRMHTGTDIKQRLNDSVFSCFDGVVRMSRTYGGYGKIVVVRHPNGLESVYSHLNKISVKPKQIVKAGQLIGLAGRTGSASTEHVHFEFRFLYEHFNSRKVLDYNNATLLSDTLVLSAKDLHRATASSTTTQASTSSDNASKSTTAATTSKPAYHIVKKGDTLYKISRTYGVSVNTLLKLNHIQESSILSIGQKIKLK
ncbi:MAG: peptidoglycan DD-metalloendopeptidase family protein [Bacteroidales bacterium]|nr:peptidoglycan DD-metalloendopeptidase family protein [Bacteroidales bacterium]